MPPSSRNLIDLTTFEGEEPSGEADQIRFGNFLQVFGALGVDDEDAIVIDDDDDGSEETVHLITLHDDENPNSASAPPSPPPRWEPPVYEKLPQAIVGTETLKPGDAVEIEPMDGSWQNAEFLAIKDIIKDQKSGRPALRGFLFCRTKHVPAPKRYVNEVCMLKRVYIEDCRPEKEQGMEIIQLDKFIRKRDITLTHEEFPTHSFRCQAQYTRPSPKEVAETGLLVCRWMFTATYDVCPSRLKRLKLLTKATEGEFRRLLPHESDTPLLVSIVSTKPGRSSNNDIFDQGQTIRTFRRRCPSVEIQQSMETTTSSKISYGSGCSGAGGDAYGARKAEASVIMAWDMNPSAYKTFIQNHPDVDVYNIEQFDFLNKVRISRVIDILHLSWPCDFFSPNHTVSGRNDDQNSAAIFATKAHLEKCRPRIHTQEQTFGLFSHHPDYFFAIIRDILDAGYNVKWKIAQFRDHGLPALRKRLIIFAARVGTPLPNFPPKTHGPPGSGLRPFRTILDALENIPEIATCHLDMASPYRKGPKPMYDPKNVQAKCITRNGGCISHPSGLRPFTPRELACLQGFPWTYRFSGTKSEIKVQIGNAVPPIVWKLFIRQCVKTLKDFDAGLIDVAGRPAVHEEIRFRLPSCTISPMPPSPSGSAGTTSEGSWVVIDGESQDTQTRGGVVDLTMSDV